MCTPIRGFPSMLRGKVLSRKASCFFVALCGKANQPQGFVLLRGPSWQSQSAARLHGP